MTITGLTCLIPAYNEAPRIAGVLRAIAGHPAITKTLVIDDGSTDNTAAIARAAGAHVLATGGNLGKTAALALGLQQVRTSHILLLDADLVGLTADAITALMAPVAENRATASISLRGNAPRTWRLLGIDYISGERIIPMDLLIGQLEPLSSLPRFGFEVFLNRLLIARAQPVAIIRWPLVSSPSKASKQGLVKGLRADMRMIADILHTIPAKDIIHQIRFLRHLAKQVAPPEIGR